MGEKNAQTNDKPQDAGTAGEHRPAHGRRAGADRQGLRPAAYACVHAKPGSKERLIARWDRKLGNHEEQDAHRRRAFLQHHWERPVKVTKSYEEYMAHPIAKFVMTFNEWRNPSERRRRLAEVGR